MPNRKIVLSSGRRFLGFLDASNYCIEAISINEAGQILVLGVEHYPVHRCAAGATTVTAWATITCTCSNVAAGVGFVS